MSIEHELGLIVAKWKKNESLVLDPATKLEDLEIDSLDLVEVMFEIEEKFDVSLPQNNQEARTATLADVAKWIEAELASKARPRPEAAASEALGTVS